MDRAQIDALRTLYGLDQPMVVQYFKWLGRLLTGDLGVSLDWQRPISELIGDRLLLTLLLGVGTFIFTWLIAIPIGILSATRKYSFFDYFFTVFNYVGVATPTFMTALVLMWISFKYYGINISGLFSPEYVDAPWSAARTLDLFKHLWLPIVILGMDGTARLARVMRANLLDELNKPYMEMGSVIVATVMNLPTIGPMLLRALISQDMYLAGTIILIYMVLAVIGTLISDVLLVWLDPRIRMEKTG